MNISILQASYELLIKEELKRLSFLKKYTTTDMITLSIKKNKLWIGAKLHLLYDKQDKLCDIVLYYDNEVIYLTAKPCHCIFETLLLNPKYYTYTEHNPF